MIAETALLTAPVVYGTTALALPDVFEVVSRDLRYCSRPLVRCRRVVECLDRACRGQDNIGASAVGLVVLPPDPTREIARPPQGIRVILPHIPSSDLVVRCATRPPIATYRPHVACWSRSASAPPQSSEDLRVTPIRMPCILHTPGVPYNGRAPGGPWRALADAGGVEASVGATVDAAALFDVGENDARTDAHRMAETIAARWRPLCRWMGMDRGKCDRYAPAFHITELVASAADRRRVRGSRGQGRRFRVVIWIAMIGRCVTPIRTRSCVSPRGRERTSRSPRRHGCCSIGRSGARSRSLKRPSQSVDGGSGAGSR